MVQRLAVRIFRIFSDFNPWIDYILVINRNGLRGGPEEENIIQNIYDSWHEGDISEPIGDYILNSLKDKGWDVTLYQNIES